MVSGQFDIPFVFSHGRLNLISMFGLTMTDLRFLVSCPQVKHLLFSSHSFSRCLLFSYHFYIKWFRRIRMCHANRTSWFCFTLSIFILQIFFRLAAYRYWSLYIQNYYLSFEYIQVYFNYSCIKGLQITNWVCPL